MNQGKRRLNQSLRFVRAAPLNLGIWAEAAGCKRSAILHRCADLLHHHHPFRRGGEVERSRDFSDIQVEQIRVAQRLR